MFDVTKYERDLRPGGVAGAALCALLPRAIEISSRRQNPISFVTAGERCCRAAAFKITTRGEETVLHTVGGQDDGVQPDAKLIYSGGMLYGTTSWGGAHQSCTVYAIATSGNERVIHSFAAAATAKTLFHHSSASTVRCTARLLPAARPATARSSRLTVPGMRASSTPSRAAPMARRPTRGSSN